jgi:hypothetical protein
MRPFPFASSGDPALAHRVPQLIQEAWASACFSRHDDLWTSLRFLMENPRPTI